MHLNKSSLAISVLFAITPIAYSATNIAEYNYNPNLTAKETGIHVEDLLNCGYGYASGDCQSNSPVVQKGYSDSSNIAVGTDTARSANKDNNIFDPKSTKNLGINSMDDNSGIIKYGDTRDLSKQQQSLNELYGTTGSTDLTSTYNTNSLPTAQGIALKNTCMQFSDAQLDSMLNGTNTANKDLANQCVVIRTVAVTNDKAIGNSVVSPTDPLYELVKSRSLQNTATNSVVATVTNTTESINTANSQAYACELEPTRTEYSSQLCNAITLGRNQQCSQRRVVECGSNATGDRLVPECVVGMEQSSIKMISATGGRNSSFSTANNTIFFNERWRDGSGGSQNEWIITFIVKNSNKVKMSLASYHVDNQIEIRLNGNLIAEDETNSSLTRNPNLSLNKFIRAGQNTISVKLNNWAGPAAASVTFKIDPSSFQACTCYESWQTTCNYSKVEL